MEKLLTLQEVCNLLGCRDPKGGMVRNLWKKGLIDGAKFGRYLMFRESSVEDYINRTFEQQKKKGASQRPGDEVSSTQTSSLL